MDIVKSTLIVAGLVIALEWAPAIMGAPKRTLLVELTPARHEEQPDACDAASCERRRRIVIVPSRASSMPQASCDASEARRRVPSLSAVWRSVL
jgi:hypothetical protein